MSKHKSFMRFLVIAIFVTGSCCQSGCGQEVTPTKQSGDEVVETEDKSSNDEHADHRGGKPNRLASETSPYLLAHANNPVDWYPWGEEALKKAKEENKVIFLSIGYSSCHWCHVMEHESFMDAEIARYMNENFVCIKVDREERPDIDNIYMTSLHTYNQLRRTGRGGGWPLSMFLSPNARPFFGGTYFPARDGDRGASVGFLSLMKNVHQIWTDAPKTLLADADVITNYTRSELAGASPDQLVDIEADWVEAAITKQKSKFDATYGGFTNLSSPDRPKFPEPSNLLLLIHELKQESPHVDAKEMLTVTLDRMAMGGIWDHVGQGFHRYSVDRYWRIPHFEKMLYDNGQLASVYAEAAKLTGNNAYRRTAEDICEYVISEMTAPQGAWYSALDADSEGEEGKFYRWTREEISDVLNPKEYSKFAAVYGVNKPPNFEGEYYAPQFDRPFKEIAKELGVEPNVLRESLVPIRRKLFEERAKRVRPRTDTKILTSWNGLMIRGMADTGRIHNRSDFVEAAEKAADFILLHMRTEDGRLFRTFAGSDDVAPTAKLNAYLNDYAFLIDGLIALHDTTVDTENSKWLAAAVALQNKQDELFWDKDGGAYFFTSSDHEELLARAKNPVDGAQPSGNSVSAMNLVRLAKRVDSEAASNAFLDRARMTARGVSHLLKRAPSAAPRMIIAVDELTRQE